MLLFFKKEGAFYLGPEALLVAVTSVYGANFLLTRTGVAAVSPLVFLAIRFAIAALLLALFARPNLRRATRTERRGATALAAAMLGGYGFQAAALHLGVGSGRVAFISALYVPLVPVLQLVLWRRPPRARSWVALALATAGLFLLAGPGAARGTGGAAQLLVLGASISIAGEILLLGHFAPRTEARRLAALECAVLAVFAAAGAFLSGAPLPRPALSWALCAALLGASSAFLQLSVNWAQRFVPPTRATALYTLEPVWAGLFGWLAGEPVGGTALAGAAAIFASLWIGRNRTDGAHG